MRINPQLEPRLTQAITFLRGQYALWRFKIPYYSTVVPISFAADELSLIEEIPESERIEWSLGELFQRDISWQRIHDELVKYLRSENRPQFFNALTIALLPRLGHGFAPSFEKTREYSPMSGPELESPLHIGGIQIQTFSGSAGDAGKLRWDKDEIIAVAVDGQHRLAALKELGGFLSPGQLRSSSVPLIIIVPDSRVGYDEPPPAEGTPDSLMNALRRVFIDINKNAREVSRARNILLDDEDIVSVCTRRLIGERLSATAGMDRIPLALVDWQSEKNKIDVGPFLSTVLILYELVDQALSPPVLRDLDEEEEQRVQNWLEQRFWPAEEDLDQLMSQVRRCFNQEVPLMFLPADLSILAKLFDEHWRPLLYRIFREVHPYSEVWQYGAANQLHIPQAVNLYAAETFMDSPYGTNRAEHIQNAIRADDPGWNRHRAFDAPLEHIDKTLKSGKWAFAAVFQRALFGSFLELLQQSPEFLPADIDPQARRTRFTSMWLEAINCLLRSDLGAQQAHFGRPRDYFWVGIGLRPDRTIDFTNAGRRRLQKWLIAWTCLYWSEGDLPSLRTIDGDDRELIRMIGNALTQKRVMKGFERLALARDPALSEDDATVEAKKLASKRLDHLCQLKSRN